MVLWRPLRLKTKSRSRAPAPPSPFEQLPGLDADIATARAKLDAQRDVDNIAELSALLRRRFFVAGDINDLQDSFELSDQVPIPTLDTIGTASLAPRPELRSAEWVWVQWQPWLKSQGYQLLTRYDPKWIPSWIAHPETVQEMLAEDGAGTRLENVNAAIRIKDGVTVWLKLCREDEDPEIDIYVYFATEPRRSDPRNHCCPLLDILRTPLHGGKRHNILVVPILRSISTKPDPETVKDLVDGIVQLAEGLEYLHEHNVAHRDIHIRNVMFDASKHIPDGWHPFHTSFVYPTPGGPSQWARVLPYSSFPVKYYYIDFGLSFQFPSKSERRKVVGTAAMNHSVPEMSNTVPYDPFPVDIRMFGDFLKTLQDRYLGLEFLDPLIVQLVQEDPTLRLTAPEMLTLLLNAVSKHRRWKSMRPLRYRQDSGSYSKVWLRYPFRVLGFMR
ncbi:hypothetical protein EXIGLDRAFT_726179 [Exidia glandulosa HHB12029]|uniref:Protein kinase domain-containing protein n=1 Tax=Exidia glandulosa HHB12029 TaxID=1314781 RepID=A0A165MD02_EXIGL|nr:hypothetical protein EXIGLDRAFT_726179 [Exidia glandulosa HHB12029]